MPGAEDAASASRGIRLLPVHITHRPFPKRTNPWKRHGFPRARRQPPTPTPITARHEPPISASSGAGSSGITVGKALKQQGLAFDCFEKGSDISGCGATRNDNGLSSCYASLHIDTSRPNLGYSDFPIDHGYARLPFPRPVPAPSRSLCRSFRASATLVSFKPRSRSESNPWRDAGACAYADKQEAPNTGHVIVANGHLWGPAHAPDFAGRFPPVRSCISHDYRTCRSVSRSKRVLVGWGSGAIPPWDIAVDLFEADGACLRLDEAAARG